MAWRTSLVSSVIGTWAAMEFQTSSAVHLEVTPRCPNLRRTASASVFHSILATAKGF
jgi:hypothetical protein